nr:hypothetical protein GCM10020093_000770 [Planobispora longispora]
MNWNHLLTEQLDWHWENHLRPGLDGLTDDEYFWEPVDGCWSVRPRGAAAPRSPPGAVTSSSSSRSRNPIRRR